MSAPYTGHMPAKTAGKSTIQKMLDQNSMLIQAIVKYQNFGRVKDAARYQQLLHRNLVYLATLANSNLLQQLNDNNTSPKTPASNTLQKDGTTPEEDSATANATGGAPTPTEESTVTNQGQNQAQTPGQGTAA